MLYNLMVSKFHDEYYLFYTYCVYTPPIIKPQERERERKRAMFFCVYYHFF
jgi:hypothetical protein